MRPTIPVSFLLVALAAAVANGQGTTACIDGSSQSYRSAAIHTIHSILNVTRTYTHTDTWKAEHEEDCTRYTRHTHHTSPTSTTSTTSSASSTSSSAPAAPTAPYSVIAARSGSPIHLLPLNAGGLSFHLGGSTAAYCPTDVTDQGGVCPPGNVTAFLGTCSMDVEVPGGQQIWATPDGAIGYTQAHSISEPVDSVPCPFTYSKQPGEQFGHLSTNVFGASGLMACPNLNGGWDVFAALQNATVPNGNVSSCLGFDALTVDYTSSDYNVAAWQYT